MTTVSIGALVVAAFAACWLGLYLLARDPREPLLWSSGSGLLAYAVSLSAAALGGLSPAPLPFWTALQRSTLLLPLLFWMGTLLLMLPEEHPWRARAAGAWRMTVIPVALAVAVAAPWLFPDGETWSWGTLFLLSIGVALFAVLGAYTTWQLRQNSGSRAQGS